MANYRTAMGKTIDMASLAKRNEHTRAVGNMNVNARGDTIDAKGKVIVPVTEKVNDAYSKTVGNRSAQVRSRPAPPVPVAPKIEAAQLNEIELELEESMEDDIEVEQIKAAEKKAQK
jgi:hypothetical protein